MKVEIVISSFLPVDEVVPASNIKTRMQVSLATGKKTHAIKDGNVMIVSREMYETMKNQSDERH